VVRTEPVQLFLDKGSRGVLLHGEFGVCVEPAVQLVERRGLFGIELEDRGCLGHGLLLSAAC
jgi:hypothetical protein